MNRRLESGVGEPVERRKKIKKGKIKKHAAERRTISDWNTAIKAGSGSKKRDTIDGGRGGGGR
jgi:hypothetical protein